MRSRLRRPIDWETWIKLLVLILVIAGFVALAVATREAGMHESSHPPAGPQGDGMAIVSLNDTPLTPFIVHFIVVGGRD